MTADVLREAASKLRADATVEYGRGHISWRETQFKLAVARWLDAESQAHIHVPGSDRPKSAYDMPGMDTSPAVAAARAYLGDQS